jgi:branched-chain amino acid transport system permease protein
MSAVIQALLIGIVVGALYSLVALGFGLIMGVMRFVNIAHGSFIIIGGYIAYWLFTLWGIDPYLSIPAVMVCMFVMGLLLYRLALAPLLKYPRAEMRMDKSLLITFGVTWVLDNAVTLVWTPDTRSVITSYSGSTIDVFGARLGLVGLTGLVIAILIAVFLHLLLTRTYFGKHVRAATEDSGAAALSGVNVQRTYLISCGIAAALGGVAGVVIVSSYSVAPSGGLNWLLTAMVVIVLAGEGNITAILPAGLILGVLQSMSTLVVSPAYQQPISLIVFILVLLLRPNGLFAHGGMNDR